MRPWATMIKSSFASVLLLLVLGAAPLSASVIVSGWDFQNVPAVTNLTPPSDLGTVTGAASTVGMNNSYPTPGPSVDISDVTASTGSSDPAGANNNCWRVRGGPAANQTTLSNGWSSLAPIGTQGAQFLVSTAGFSGIQLRFDLETTAQAEANLEVQYTLDGTTWTNIPVTYTGTGATVKTNTTSANTVTGGYIQFTGGAWFNGIVADFSAITGASNNPKFGVRIVNAATGADDVNGSGTAYNNNSGNWRFDEVQVTAASAVPFAAGNLVVSRSVYTYSGAIAALKVGAALPDSADGVTAFLANAAGTYPNVFNNDTVDGSFGVTSPIFLDQITTAGALVGTLPVPVALVVTSFPSKSELALNLTSDGQSLTFMGYSAPVGAIDVSNSNTPGVIEPGNYVTTTPAYREVVQVSSAGNFTATTTNAYSGNNGRAAVAANGLYFMVGNAGNGNGSAQVTAATGVQVATPGVNATASAPGTQAVGSFNITQNGYAADKTAKDNNFRGLTVYNNTLYISKGSGSNGINTVYQVGASGSLPTLANAAAAPIAVLPGFPTVLAKSVTGVSHPFGLWFANATTLYVGDEGDGVLADLTNGIDPNSGLQKWILVSGTWKLAYTLKTGLNLGVNYTPTDGLGNNYFPTATDGIRNITGQINGDGTVTLYAVTSTVSASGDQGADPNKLMAITDTLSYTTATQAANESFSTLRMAGYGEVLRGVSFTPGSVINTGGGTGSQPQASLTAAAGTTVALSFGQGGTPAPTYQWYENGTAIAGATHASLLISGATAANAGTYTLVTTGAGGTTASQAVALSVTGSTAPAQMSNVSALASVGAGSRNLNVGFVVGGSVARTVLIRATGPALAGFGVTGALADPQLALYSGSTQVASDAGWGGDSQLTNAGTAVGAFPVTNTTSADSMLLISLPPGPYTVQVSSVSGGSGVALLEVYSVP